MSQKIIHCEYNLAMPFSDGGDRSFRRKLVKVRLFCPDILYIGPTRYIALSLQKILSSIIKYFVNYWFHIIVAIERLLCLSLLIAEPLVPDQYYTKY